MTELRRWLTVGLAIAVLCLCLAVLTMCQRGKLMRSETVTATATGKALDNVSSETEKARAEQVEKQNEVDRIEGADQRLPDGFGRELECVRRNCERRNP